MTQCSFSLPDQCVLIVSRYQPVHPSIWSHSPCGLGQHQLWARTPAPRTGLVSTLMNVGLCRPGARCLKTDTQTCARAHTHTDTHMHNQPPPPQHTESPSVQSVKNSNGGGSKVLWECQRWVTPCVYRGSRGLLRGGDV